MNALDGHTLPLSYSDFKKKHCEDLNSLTSEKIKIFSNQIFHVLYKKNSLSSLEQEEENFLNHFYADYQVTYQKSVLIAQSLHQEFLKLFEGTQKPTLNSSEKTVTVSYDQFIFGSSLLKKYFPGLYYLACVDSHHNWMSQLLKIIFIGSEEDHSTDHLTKTFVFSINEVDNLTSKDLVQFKMMENSPGSSYLDEVLMQLIQNYNIEKDSTLSDYVGLVFDHFNIAIIKNPMVSFYFENGNKFWPKDLENSFESFITSFVRVYLSVKISKCSMKSVVQDFCKKLLKQIPDNALDIHDIDFFTNLFSKIPLEIKEKFLSLTSIEENHDLECFIRLKIFEFALFTANFNGHNVLESFGNEYKNCTTHKKFNCLEINLLEHRYILDEDLRCTEHVIKNEINAIAKELQNVDVDRNFKSNSQSLYLSLSLKFKKISRRLFHIHYLKFPHLIFINSCTFDWNTAKFLTEGALGLGMINPNAFALVESFRFKKFMLSLDVFAKLELRDSLKFEGDLTFEKVSEGWWSYLVPSLRNTEIETEKCNELVKNLLEFYKQADILTKSYLKKIKFSRSEDNNLIYRLRVAIDQSKKGLENLAKTMQNNGVTSASDLFQNIFNRIDQEWFQEVPVVPYSLYEYTVDKRGVLEYFTSGLFQSENPEDIDWKIHRYQSVLRQLRDIIGNLLDHSFSEEEKNLFFQSVFNSKIETDSQKLILNLLNLDLNERKGNQINQRYLSQIRDEYAINFIMTLRDILLEIEKNEKEIGLSDQQKKLQNFFYELCEALFTMIDLKEISLELNEKFNVLGKDNLSVLDDICQKDDGSLTFRVSKMHENFYKARQSAKAPYINKIFNSARGNWNFGFDPTTQSNNPQCIGKIALLMNGVTQSIKLLAFGSPTIEGYFGGESYAKVSIEFLSWMKNYKKQNKRHLFVINQDLTSGGSFFGRILGGDETDRIYAILKSCTDSEAQGTLFCIVLSRNSVFYAQKSVYEFQSDASIYKKNLLEQHFDFDPTISGNHIPNIVLNEIPDLKDFCEKAIESIHSILFKGRKSLTLDERCVFYDFFQDNLILKITMELYANSVNMGCKDAIDRAAEAVARLCAYLGIVNTIEDFKETYKEMYKELRKQYEVLLMTRALLVRKREIIPTRIKRNIVTVSYYEKHKIELRAVYNTLFGANIFKLVL